MAGMLGMGVWQGLPVQFAGAADKVRFSRHSLRADQCRCFLLLLRLTLALLEPLRTLHCLGYGQLHACLPRTCCLVGKRRRRSATGACVDNLLSSWQRLISMAGVDEAPAAAPVEAAAAAARITQAPQRQRQRPLLQRQRNWSTTSTLHPLQRSLPLQWLGCRRASPSSPVALQQLRARASRASLWLCCCCCCCCCGRGPQVRAGGVPAQQRHPARGLRPERAAALLLAGQARANARR